MTIFQNLFTLKLKKLLKIANKNKKKYFILDNSNDSTDVEKNILKIVLKKLSTNVSINNLDNINISSDLYGHDYVLMNFIKLYENKNFPKVSLLTGEKGIGNFIIFFI